jgi:hypothetical protein
MQSILVDHITIGSEVFRELQPLSPLALVEHAVAEMMQDVAPAIRLAMCTTPQHPKLTQTPDFKQNIYTSRASPSHPTQHTTTQLQTSMQRAQRRLTPLNYKNHKYKKRKCKNHKYKKHKCKNHKYEAQRRFTPLNYKNHKSSGNDDNDTQSNANYPLPASDS